MPLPPSPIGYLIAADRYQKRDELGYVTQINVLPEYRRSLVAGQLLQAQFDRSAYGCRLYCCWCAQDLAANAFWEAMGFTAIAFRTGSMKRGKRGQGAADRGQQSNASIPPTPLPLSPSARVHIFWQKRIRDGDTSTPWWYPSQTGGGVLRADRLVFPIPTGVHWKDVGPIVLGEIVSCELPVASEDAASSVSPLATGNGQPVTPRSRARKAPPAIVKPLVSPRARGGFWAAEEGVPDTFKTQKQLAEEARAARHRERATTTKKALRRATKSTAETSVATSIDPRLTAMSRELRDQWAERADAIVSPTIGKHDVKRIARASSGVMGIEPLRLEQAA